MTATIPTTRRAAFTLVELLVVITIIGILIGLLVPVTAGIYERALTAACSSNMSQIAKSVLQYTQQNNQMIPAAVYRKDKGGTAYSGKDSDRPHWCNTLVITNFIDAPNTAALGTHDETTTQDNIFRCPSGTLNLWKDDGYPTAEDPAQPAVLGFMRLGTSDRKIDCWYYWNGSSNDTENDPKTEEVHAKDFPSMAVPPDGVSMAQLRLDPSLGYHRLDAIKRPASMAMLADGVGIDAGTDPASENLARIAARHSSSSGRHTLTNIAFWDGHVESISRSPNNLSQDGIYLTEELHTGGSPYFRISDQGP